MYKVGYMYQWSKASNQKLVSHGLWPEVPGLTTGSSCFSLIYQELYKR